MKHQQRQNQMQDKNLRNSQRRRPVTVVVAAVMLMICMIFAIAAYAAEPGSNDDPIALKSYVDTKLSALESKLTGVGAGTSSTDAGMEEKLDELAKRVDALTAENEALKRAVRQGDGNAVGGGEGGGSVGISTAASVFEIYEVKTGERVLLGAGTEMVIRTGKAQAIRGELGGVVDLITGVELDAGAEVGINHLLLAARNDGRGIRFTQDAFVMIKGGFDLR